MLFKLLGPKRYLIFDSFVEKHTGLYVAFLFIGIPSLILLPFFGLYYFGNLNQDFTDIGFIRAKVTGATVIESDDDRRRMLMSFVTSDGIIFSTTVRPRHFAMKGDIVCLKQRIGEDETTHRFRQVDEENCQNLKPFTEPEPPLVR
jgi:hypothetical protein